jgi:hypothetical protein
MATPSELRQFFSQKIKRRGNMTAQGGKEAAASTGLFVSTNRSNN